MSRKQSAFIQQVETIRRAAQEATRKTYEQYITDMICLTLNDYGWGEQRIRKFLPDIGKNYDLYFDALRDEPETDYLRAKIDERMARIAKSGDWEPFETRYQFLREQKY